MVEDLQSLHYELEQAQCNLARENGALPPFTEEKWIPVSRIKATDQEVDALVDSAETELNRNQTKETPNLPLVVKTRGEKKMKALQIMKSMKSKTRKEIISKFINELGMSTAMASTYFQSLKGNV